MAGEITSPSGEATAADVLTVPDIPSNCLYMFMLMPRSLLDHKTFWSGQ